MLPHSAVPFSFPCSGTVLIFPYLFSPTISCTESNGARGYWRTILHSMWDPWSPFPEGISCVILWAARWVQWSCQPLKRHRVATLCFHNVYALLLWSCLKHRFLLIILKNSFPRTERFSFTFRSLKPHPLSSEWQSRRNALQLCGLPN